MHSQAVAIFMRALPLHPYIRADGVPYCSIGGSYLLTLCISNLPTRPSTGYRILFYHSDLGQSSRNLV